ncbi:hypothetical protein SUGI_1078560 [Cryptomeria japonica]|nr:hypothetical protein SUGI_1078560 [Cryptomeria japonica]
MTDSMVDEVARGTAMVDRNKGLCYSMGHLLHLTKCLSDNVADEVRTPEMMASTNGPPTERDLNPRATPCRNAPFASGASVLDGLSSPSRAIVGGADCGEFATAVVRLD